MRAQRRGRADRPLRLVVSARGETAIGYRLAAQSWSRPNFYGVHLNPNKAAAVTLGAGDSVIVLAQDEH